MGLIRNRAITFYGNDELGYDGKNLVATVLEHVMNSLASEKLVRVFGFAKAVEK